MFSQSPPVRLEHWSNFHEILVNDVLVFIASVLLVPRLVSDNPVSCARYGALSLFSCNPICLLPCRPCLLRPECRGQMSTLPSPDVDMGRSRPAYFMLVGLQGD